MNKIETKWTFTVESILSNFCDFFLFSTYFLFVCKEFLQNIPGSVLTSGLYDEWLGVPDQECEEKKVAAAQR